MMVDVYSNYAAPLTRHPQPLAWDAPVHDRGIER